MRIFIIARGYPTKENPLLGIFEFDQAKALKNKGHEVIYIAVDLRSLRRKRKLGYSSFIKDGINIEEISVPVGAVPRDFLIKIGSYFTCNILNKAEKKYGHPDIVHAHFLNTAAMVSKVISKEDNYVITEHSSMLNQNLSSKQKKRYAAVYEKADMLITVSHDLQKRIKNVLGIDSVCIHNMIDTKNFNYIPKPDGNFSFITISSLTPNKRVDLMIKGFNEFVKNNNITSNVKLHIIGDGEERKNLQKLATQFDIKNKIYFHGILSHNEVKKIFDISNCFILTSKKETFGVACAEALLSGIPVIITKCGGPEEFIDDTNGIVIEDYEISEAMKYMYNHIGDYDGEMISKKIYQQFSEESIVTKLEEAYYKLIAEKNN